MDKKHLFTLSLILIVVMLFSAVGSTTVYADDGTPPDTTATEASGTDSQPVDGGDTGAQTDGTNVDQAAPAATDEVATEAPVDETSVDQVEPVSTEEAPTEAPAATDEVATEAPVDETATGGADATEPSLMEQVPDNTEVVVVNADGTAEPLATQEAADAVAVSDPVWCPAGVAPGGSGCTGAFSSFDSLLTELATNASYSGAGTIYVEIGTYNTSESSVDFNSYSLDNIRNSDLTIQGGWNPANDPATIAQSDRTSFNIPILIGSEANPWGGSITIRNISVSRVKGDTPALGLYSNGNVAVEDSEINNNGSNAQEIVDGEGLKIRSGGSVRLNRVQANDNQIYGADIQQTGGGPLDIVSITDSTFNGNLMYTLPDIVFYGYGLTVVSQVDIAVENVQANGNYLWGALLDGPNVDIRTSQFNQNVSNSNAFVDDTGLRVISDGRVNLLTVEANDNRKMGADIQAGGQVSIRDSSFSRNYGVTVDATGNNVYWGCGLQVGGQRTSSADPECGVATPSAAPITLATVTADNNYFFGAYLLSSAATGLSSDVINISNSSFSNVAYSDGINDGFPQAQLEGLKVQAGGDVNVTLSTIVVNNNQTSGANIVANGDIRINDSSFFSNHTSFGLSAESTAGTIYLENVTASRNGGDGAYAKSACVYLDGGVFTGNGGYGLNVFNGKVDQAGATDYGNIIDNNLNTLGDTNPNPFNPCDNSGGGGVIFTSPPLYTVASLTQNQLPGALSQGNTFVSALQVTSSASSGSFELSFPIPAGMENSNFAVMFWDGTQWVEVPGGSVVNGAFVITVTQPGIYVLVAQFT